MAKSRVAVLKTSPATVLSDYHELLNLAGYQDVLSKDVDTALKINISWHFFYPGSSTTPCTSGFRLGATFASTAPATIRAS